MLHEWIGKTTESVTVGNHNFSESALQRVFQNGVKTFAVPVDATADVGDNVVGGIGGTKIGDLALKARFLMGGGDPAVTDALFLFVAGRNGAEFTLNI